MINPVANDGKTRWRRYVKNPSLGWTNPATGKSCHLRPNAIIRRKPKKKSGIENPSEQKIITSLSIILFAFQAARTPNGTAVLIANSSVKKAMETVGSNLSQINLVTLKCDVIEVPRSPREMSRRNNTSCIGSDLSKPRECLISTISCSVASHPAIIRAGSPGVILRRRKVKNTTTNITGIVMRRRLMI
jgi:hypothetical protein